MTDIQQQLSARASGRCELCGSEDDLGVHELALSATSPEPAIERSVLACAVCRAQLDGDAPLDAKHWFCLQEAAWSEVPAVKVTSYGLLAQLRSVGEAGWAGELLDQLYLDEDTAAWAESVAKAAGPDQDQGEGRPRTVDSNGVELADGDSVTLIKDLDVKGANFVAKRGTMVKGIRLTDDPGHVEGRVNKVALVLKTEFLKRV